MIRTFQTKIAGKEDFQSNTTTTTAWSVAEIFSSKNNRIGKILNRTPADVHNEKLLQYVIFQSILKSIRQELLEQRDRLPTSVMDNLILCLSELDLQIHPSHGKLDQNSPNSLKFALEYRFRNKKNLLETLLQSWFYDMNPTNESHIGHIRTLMVQSKLAVPTPKDEIQMRLFWLSKAFVAYDGTPLSGFREDILDFVYRMDERKNINLILGNWESLFQVILAHSLDPRNSIPAGRCLQILFDSGIAFKNSGWYIDPDVRASNGHTTDRIIEEKYHALKKHPDNFPPLVLERARKSAYGWLGRARAEKAKIFWYWPK